MCRALWVAPSACLASFGALTGLVGVVSSDDHRSLSVSFVGVALARWLSDHMLVPPQSAAAFQHVV